MSRQSEADYLKSDDLGLVIAKGMAVMYKEDPKNPVDFLAKWLLNYSQVEKAAVSKQEQALDVQKNQQAHQKAKEEQATAEEAKKQEAGSKEEKQNKFQETVKESNDLGDQLQSLVDHLQDFTGATAVYIGKLVSPKKPIKDGDDDEAHIDDASDKILQFNNSTKDHQFLVDQILRKDQGLTFDVFKDIEANPDAEDGAPATDAADPTLPRHVLVPEVVRENRIHFYKVPRLGSYLAIKLEYQSCLSTAAYDAGIKDYNLIKTKLSEQEEEKKQWEEDMKEKAEAAEADGDENWKPEERTWKEIEPADFQTHDVQFVVCMNTLGQDREFTEEQVKFALNTVKMYRDEWVKIENENLKKDIERKIDQGDFEKAYKETNEALDIAQLDKLAEDACQAGDGQDPLTEDQRNLAMKKARFSHLTKTFYDPEGFILHQKQMDRERARANASGDRDRAGTPNTSQHAGEADATYHPLVPEQWKKGVQDIKDRSIIKMPRVLQSLFYLLRYERDQICESGTNKLDLKKVKKLIGDELFKDMANYHPFDANHQGYKEYQKLAFLKKQLESIEEEKVEEYDIVMSKIYKWVNTAIELRCEDVVSRRDAKEVLKKDREDAIAADGERTTKMEAELAQRKADFEAKIDEEFAKAAAEAEDDGEEGEEKGEKPELERPPFPQEEFDVEFEAANPLIEIPADVQDDIDNDYDLPYSPPVMGE